MQTWAVREAPSSEGGGDGAERAPPGQPRPWGERLRGVAPWAAWSLYVGLLATVVLHHEPWADEGHAWVLARDCSLWELVWRELRYEGSPGLWHLLLWGVSHAGLPFQSMQWLPGGGAGGGGVLSPPHGPVPLPGGAPPPLF